MLKRPQIVQVAPRRDWADIPAPAPPRPPEKTLRELLAIFLDDPVKERGHKVRSIYHNAIPIVGEVLGMDTPVRSIDRESCRRLLDMLIWLPTNSKKRFPKLTAVQASEMAKAKKLTSTLGYAAIRRAHRLRDNPIHRRNIRLNDDALLGWIEPTLVAHENNAPSLLRRVLQSSHLVRQAIYAALAFDHAERVHHPVLKRSRPSKVEPELSLLLRDGRASDIIAAVYGVVPEGFLAALERCGASPLRPAHYLRLFMIFATGDERKANALRHIGQITDQSIQVVEELL
ncbi:MAG TPA: hypothetical protein VJU34_07890, partial [Phenylobacterium sp.]|nr:hypothetical protein [Phenylobacterium sp.]